MNNVDAIQTLTLWEMAIIFLHIACVNIAVFIFIAMVLEPSAVSQDIFYVGVAASVLSVSIFVLKELS